MRIIIGIFLTLITSTSFAECGFMKYQSPGESCEFYNGVTLVNDLFHSIQWACTACVATFSYDYMGGECEYGATSDYIWLGMDNSYHGTLLASQIVQNTLPPEVKIGGVIHDTCTEDGRWVEIK